MASRGVAATARTAVVAVLALACLSTLGCNWFGAATTPPVDPTKPKPKPDFQITKFWPQPNNLSTVNSYYKPGHLTTATVEVVANNFEFPGAALESLPIAALDMPFEMGNTQPVTLPKGQPRETEVLLWVPPRYDYIPRLAARRQVPLDIQLISRASGQVLGVDQIRLRPMENFQYFFVVLSNDTTSYKFLDRLPAFDSNMELMSEDVNISRFYQVVVPPVVRRAPLPSHPLAWTSIAFVLWDDFTEDKLSDAQRQAMLDWLHFGGQLIVSGPDNLEKLRTTFLADVLPASTDGTAELSAEEIDRFKDAWSGPQAVLPRSTSKWSIAKLTPAEGSNTLAANVRGEESLPLIVERTVGRGRVVATAFRTTEVAFRSWLAVDDSIVNACLLRRPARKYVGMQDEMPFHFEWSGDTLRSPLDSIPASVLNSRHISRVSYFSRDVEAAKHQPQFITSIEMRAAHAYATEYGTSPFDRATEGRDSPPVAAWDDFGGVSQRARQALFAASGIRVPDRTFVAIVMAIYLVVLVPLNWAFFRLLRRVEWAWIAAPIITIVYAIAVVRVAHVNIGFTRPQTEVNVVELQPGYDRAHLTRYVSLYTSLATTYDITMDDPSAMLLPLADGKQPMLWQTRQTLQTERDQKVVFRGLTVASNSMSMVHAEEMYNLDGGLRLERGPATAGDAATPGDAAKQGDAAGWHVVNGTQHRLRDAEVHFSREGMLGQAVLQRVSDGTAREGAANPRDFVLQLGDLEPGQRVTLDLSKATGIQRVPSAPTFTRTPSEEFDPRTMVETVEIGSEEARALEAQAQAQAAVEAARKVALPTIDDPRFAKPKMDPLLAPLWRLAVDARAFGAVDLVAWSDETLPGMTITPAAESHRRASLFVGHLAVRADPPPKPDVVARSIVAPKPLSFDELDTEENEDAQMTLPP